jgi:16S rRNA (cytosine1402-N4)-methyltransferase
MLDCTFGGGGHSIKLINQNPLNLRILGIDIDQNVIDQSKINFESLIKRNRLALIHSNFV